MVQPPPSEKRGLIDALSLLTTAHTVVQCIALLPEADVKFFSTLLKNTGKDAGKKQR